MATILTATCEDKCTTKIIKTDAEALDLLKNGKCPKCGDKLIVKATTDKTYTKGA